MSAALSYDAAGRLARVSFTAFGQPLKVAAEIPKPTDLSGTVPPNPFPQTETIPKIPR